MELNAIREQLEELHDSAFGWAMVCCGRDRDLAAEVLQRAYCRILDGKASFSGRSEFSTWVFGVISLVAREEIRHQSRQQRRTQSISSTDVTASEVGDAGIQERELAEQLDAALSRLSVRQREILHLVFYEELTVEQAAGVLRITVGSARQHYQRGKANLRRNLKVVGKEHRSE